MTESGSKLCIGLALGSGASRGWSHIGVIKALTDAGIEPDVVAGTSVGAMIGASYAAGNLDSLERWVLNSTRSDVLRFFDIKLSRVGFVDSERFDSFLFSYVAAKDVRIADLPKKFLAVCTDLDTGDEIWLGEGPLAGSVRASMAMPGLFPAVRMDGRWLVDGGLVNPVPVSACRKLGADVVIAVNLNADIVTARRQRLAPAWPLAAPAVLGRLRPQAGGNTKAAQPQDGNSVRAPGSFYAISTSIRIFQDRITRSRLAVDPADVLVSPNVGDIGLLEFQRAAEAIAKGADCVIKALPEIRRAAREEPAG